MSERIQVRAACPTCGPLLVDAELMRCEMEPAASKPSRGLCELTCPGCSNSTTEPPSLPADRTTNPKEETWPARSSTATSAWWRGSGSRRRRVSRG